VHWSTFVSTDAATGDALPSSRRMWRVVRQALGFLYDVIEEHVSRGALPSAAIAFFAMLSAAPLLVIATFIAGLVFGQGEARRELLATLTHALGPDNAALLDGFVVSARYGSGVFATLLSAVIAVFASGRFFSALQQGLHQIWGVTDAAVSRPLRAQAWSVIMKRLSSFAMVALCGVLLIALVMAKALLWQVLGFLRLDQSWLWRLVELGVSLTMLSAMFAAILRILPEANVSWRDSILGAVVTAILFSAGAALLSWYFRAAAPGSAYGAVGSLAALLLWSYYSANIFFLGAQFTYVWAQRFGRGVEPDSHTLLLDELAGAARAKPLGAQEPGAQDLGAQDLGVERGQLSRERP
jgi:membrane protein